MIKLATEGEESPFGGKMWETMTVDEKLAFGRALHEAFKEGGEMGPQFVETVAAARKMHPTQVHEAKRIGGTFADEEIADLKELCKVGNWDLMWSALVELVVVKDPLVRRCVIERLLNDTPGIDRLTELIREIAPKTKRRQGISGIRLEFRVLSNLPGRLYKFLSKYSTDRLQLLLGQQRGVPLSIRDLKAARDDFVRLKVSLIELIDKVIAFLDDTIARASGRKKRVKKGV